MALENALYHSQSSLPNGAGISLIPEVTTAYSPDQAVILAAGRGSRLNHLTETRSKCLLEVGGQTILEYQIELLREAGIDQICVVVGYGKEAVYDVVGNGVHTIVNRDWEQTNSLYSLWLCRDWVAGSLVVMNCDVYPHPEILSLVLAEVGDHFAYDSTSGEDEEHMKVELEDGYLLAICKSLSAERTHGENVGLLSFSSATARALMEEAEALLEAGHRRLWMPAAVDRLARRAGLRGVDTVGLPWAEIDFPEDLEFARREVYPAVRAARQTLNSSAGTSLGLL
jgi:choline kinase